LLGDSEAVVDAAKAAFICCHHAAAETGDVSKGNGCHGNRTSAAAEADVTTSTLDCFSDAATCSADR